MKRRLVAMLIALAIITVFYAIFVNWSASTYNAYVTKAIEDYKKTGLDPRFAEYNAYWQVWYGIVSIVGGLILSMAWIVYINHKIWSSRKGTTTIMLSMILMMGTFSPLINNTKTQTISIGPTSTETIPVNALLYFDEECNDNQYKRWFFYNALTAEPVSTFAPHTKFNNWFSIDFIVLNGCNGRWDSKDTESDPLKLLQEGIQQLGGTWDANNQWWYWEPKNVCINGTYYWVDLLILVVGQGMDFQGISPPEWNATALSFNPTPETPNQLMTHELSHQFWCYNCQNLFCIMCPGGFGEWWCDSCKNTIWWNREKYGYKALITTQGFGGGTINIPDLFQRIRGTQLTIEAFPYDGFSFCKWIITGTETQEVYTNPYTFTLVSNVYMIRPVMASPYDINHDGRIDIKDIFICTKAFASYGPDYWYPGSPASSNWNADCDFNHDGKVDMRDYFQVCKYYGKLY